MNLTSEHIEFIERLRVAASEHGVVVDLLELFAESIVIGDSGDRRFVGDDDDAEWIQAAQVAAKFVTRDRAQGKD